MNCLGPRVASIGDRFVTVVEELCLGNPMFVEVRRLSQHHTTPHTASKAAHAAHTCVTRARRPIRAFAHRPGRLHPYPNLFHPKQSPALTPPRLDP